MFDAMDIDIWQVIAAASTKPFGFTPFYPGPGIGGDCIPVDPSYLIWKAKEKNAPVTMLTRALEVNDEMTSYVAGKVIHALSLDHIAAHGANVLVLGAAFKKDVSDIRESSSLKVICALAKEGMQVSYHDPFIKQLCPSKSFPNMHLSSIQWEGVELQSYDSVIILTDHSFYPWEKIGKESRRIVDTRGVMIPFTSFHPKVVMA